MHLRPEQCRAARGFLDWSQERLAQTAGVSRSTIRDFESGRHELHRATEAALVGTLEGAGISILDADASGPGLRCRGATGGEQE